MQKGYVLLDMRPDMKSISRKNVFFFRDVMDYPGLKVTLIDMDGRAEEIDLKGLSRRAG